MWNKLLYREMSFPDRWDGISALSGRVDLASKLLLILRSYLFENCGGGKGG